MTNKDYKPLTTGGYANSKMLQEYRDRLFIVRNRRHERKGFCFELAGNKYAYNFEYTADGWEACINKIKAILEFYKKSIDKILQEN